MASGSFTATIATAVYSLALDQSAPDQSVVLGEVVFQDWEIPERVTWGGSHKLNVHKLVGGDRVIDAMGPDNAELTWSGIFLSQDAAQRADQLDQMRKDGQLRSFIFGGRFYYAYISSFQAEQRMLSWIPYTISLTVWRDQSTGAPQFLPNPLAEVLADAIAVNSLLGAPPKELLAAAATMAGVPPALQALPALVIGTAGTAAANGGLSASSVFLGTAQADSATKIDALNAQGAKNGTLAGGNTVVDAQNNMIIAQHNAQVQATSVSAKAYTDRALATTAANG